MKKIFALFSILALALSATGCIEPVDEEITELKLKRCLEPMNLGAKVIKGEYVIFTWDVTKDAEQYALQVFSDEGMTAETFSATLSSEDIPYTAKLVADQSYWFKVQALSSSKSASKWASYGKAVKTYAVKDPLYLELDSRTAESVTLKWDATISDAADVTHISYCKTGSEDYSTVNLDASHKSAGSVTIDGLAPSTEYDFILYYLSATRGEVDVWTMPDPSGTTRVSSTAELINAITGKAPAIYLTMDGSPYVVADVILEGQISVSSGMKILGEESADGTRPVIKGELHIADDFDGGALHFEGVEFNGASGTYGFPIQLKNGGTASLVPIESLTFRNCTLTGYSKGLIYEWGHTMKVGKISWEGCDINNINGDGSGGGDVIDFRGASEISELDIVNNTIYQGMRTFIRIDAATVGALKVENNTMMNLCFVDNTNNAGIFGLQIKPTEMTFKNNLIIYESGIAKLESANTKYIPAADQSMAVSNNWFYSLPEGFFSDNFTQAQALAGGGKILDSDPCYNAKGGYFNLVNTDAAAAKVGASKWWVEYVEKPEDLTLNLIAGAHTWDFTNAKYFIGEIEKSKVRDQLLMGVTENNLNVVDGTMNFTTATSKNKYGVPVDGYLAFKVDKPGSVYIKPCDAEALGNHLVIAVGPVSGASATVKGGAAANADMTTTQKILISDITEESIVYIYASGAIGIEKLAWSNDVKQVNTALDAPKPSITPASVNAGDAKDLTVTWDSVENAGSYSVVFSGKTYAVDGFQFTVSGDVVKMLDAGSYNVSVYANPSEDDIYNTESAAGVCSFAVLPKGGGGGETEFIVSSAEELLTAISAGKDEITLAFSDTPYAVGTVNLTAPIHLKGQTQGDAKSPITANFILSGDIGGSVIFTNLEFVGDGTSVITDDKTNAPVADTVAILDSYLHDTKAIYDNSGKATSDIQNVIFAGNIISNCSAAADFIDMRAGAHHNFVFVNNTVSNSCRTFIRTDAGHEMNYATIRNNTFYKVATIATSKDNNGLFHIRSAAGTGLVDYKIQNNLIYSILIDETPGNAAGFPKFKSKTGLVPNTILNNYFYNCEDRTEKADYSFWAYMDKAATLTGGGAILPADPCVDAEGGDFTLTNGVAINANVGDPRWNPSRGGAISSEITVANVDELLTAISAGKSTITLSEGEYDFTAITDNPDIASGKLTVSKSLTITGQANSILKGGFQIAKGVDKFTLDGITLDGASSVDNAVYVTDGASVGSISLNNVTVKGFKNRLFNQDKETSKVASLLINRALVSNMGTSGDCIDIRKGTFSAVKIQNSTFFNGIRTFLRIDAAVVCNSVQVINNTFSNLCSVDSKDNNGIMHVRSSSVDSTNIIVRSNIFANMKRASDTPSNANGFPKIVSSSSRAVKIPTFLHNYFYNIEEGGTYSWWNMPDSTVAKAGFGIVLSSDPFKDGANGDFTLTNALAASENVGDPRWNPNYERYRDTPFEVASTDELLTAINAGKSNILLTGTSYDLTTVTDENITAGVLKVVSDLKIAGRNTCGVKPAFVGGFKLAATEGGFELNNINLAGVSADGSTKIGNMIDIDASAVLSKLNLVNCIMDGYTNRLVSGSGESTCGAVLVMGNIAKNFGTSGDFIDFRKGTVKSIRVVNNTFCNGIRTFLRVDDNVVCSAINVENNTFFNLGAVDSKDNNGILHVRSNTAVADARQIVVRKNIFASMHRTVAEPANAAAGFPHMISQKSAAKAVPTITDNLFWDIDAEGSYGWWTYMPEENVAACGTVLSETPFTGDTASCKFTVATAWKGYGDTRW